MEKRLRRRAHTKGTESGGVAHPSRKIPQAPVIEVFAYGPDSFIEEKITKPADVGPFLDKWPVIWVNVDGLGDATAIHEFGEIFGLHELALEDVVNTHQRAKVERYGDEIFIVVRMYEQVNERVHTEQLSIFLTKKAVISFQERPGGDPLGPVRERIRKGWGQIRDQKADYLAYAIMDAVIDRYFPILEDLGDALDTLEDDILEANFKNAPLRIHQIKRDIIALRRAIWPVRDVVNELSRDTNPLIQEQTRLYMRDVYDHTLRLMDLIETYREIGSDLMDLYLSSVSNRLNEVMKVLTIITTIFIPPTFIAGVYGMNFNPKVSPFNMPELEWYYGYPFALALMAMVTVGLVIYLWRRGWLRSQEIAFESEEDLSQQTLTR